MIVDIKILTSGRSLERDGQRLPLRIGRAKDNEITLADSRVSRYHGVIDCDNRGCFYDDLGSTNGSFLRREGRTASVCGRTYLEPGDAIVIGGKEASLVVSIKSMQTETPCHGAGETPDREVPAEDPLFETITAEITPNGESTSLATDPGRARSILDFVDGLSRVGLAADSILAAAPRLLLEMHPDLSEAAIYLRSAAGWHNQPAGWVSRKRSSMVFSLSRLIGKRVLETGRAFLFQSADPAFQTRSILETGVAYGMCVPLCDRQGVRGVVQVTSRTSRNPFCNDDLRLFSAAARYLATALENADLSDQLERMNATLTAENLQLRRQASEAAEFGGIVGKSKAMQRCLNLAAKVVPSRASVLILGETGTGKELIARAIHYNGPRKDKPFVVQDCGSLAESLLESELFGHRKGSFTGAVEDKKGLFEVAHKGTVFLDEIGDCSPALQMRLLRVLQQGEIRRIGETTWHDVDVRIIAATNRNLEEAIERGSFREDLYYRLSVFPLFVPPLRDRPEDIPLLVAHFMEKIRQRTSKQVRGITKQAVEILAAYSFPGNVRELENEIERAMTLTEPGTTITADLLSQRVRGGGATTVARGHHCWKENEQGKERRQEPPEQERTTIIQLLRRHAGNLTRVARELGTSRPTLYRRLRELEIDHREFY